VRDIGQISGGAVVVAVLALFVEGGFALLQRSLGPKEGARPKRVTGPAVVNEEVHA
jgi:ABC-type proline/glycine betaine transport system permease subunit